MKDEGGITSLQLPTSKLQLLALAWKYLLQNHPHDSICGCSIDQVHAEMAPRFDWVEQIAEQVIKESLATIVASIDTHARADAVPIVVFNPVAGPRTDVATVSIEVPGSMEEFILLDDAGNATPYQILNRRVDEYYHAQATGELLGTLMAMAQEGRVLGMAIQDAFVRTDETPIRVDVTLTSQGEPNLAVIKDGLPQIQQIIADKPDATFDVRAHSPTKFEIEFIARDVPGYGYRTLSAKSIERGRARTNADTTNPRPHLPWRAVPGSASTPALAGGARVRVQLAIENEFFRVEPNDDDGTLTIIDKTTGAVYRGVNHFVDSGDRGDLYNYCPPENDSPIAQPSAPPRVEIERGAARQSLRITINYRLPAQLSADRTTRAAELIDERIVTIVSLYPGVRRIDFRTEVDNRARDHRLRVEFPTPIVTSCANVEQAFDVVTRSLDLPTNTTDWIEQPRPEAPMQRFVSIDDGKTGVTLATRGLPEYAAWRDTEGTTLVLTLLRCTGWLSRDDLSTRAGNAGPTIETPGAQEIGARVFEYALIPGDWRDAFTHAHAFAAPLRAVAASAHTGTLAPAMSFAEASPHEWVISAIKPAENGSGLIVRGYNITEQPVDATLQVWREFTRAVRVTLDEEEIAPIALRDGRAVELPVRGKEIVTIKFEV